MSEKVSPRKLIERIFGDGLRKKNKMNKHKTIETLVESVRKLKKNNDKRVKSSDLETHGIGSNTALFVGTFEKHPSLIKVEIDEKEMEGLEKLFVKSYSLCAVQEDYGGKNFIFRHDKAEVLLVFDISEKNLTICFDLQSEEALNAVEEFKKFQGGPKEGKIYFLCHEGNFYLHSSELKNTKIDLELNYGKEFLEVDKKVKEFLQENNPGLVLLHGVSGSGKTTYIKHLVNSISSQKFIYVPSHLTNMFSDPAIMPFFLEEGKDCVIILEDAEEVLAPRNEGGKNTVSNILNLSDGLLAESLQSRLICSFNTKKTQVDPALLRKGRLKVEHEFLPLGVEEANKLLKHLGVEDKVTKPTVLSDLYNWKLETGHIEKTEKIGF